MKKFKVVHTFGNVIHEGSKSECNLILSALSKYGVAEHKFDLVEVTTNRLSEATREEVEELLAEMIHDGWDRHTTRDTIMCGYKGLSEEFDESLVELLEMFIIIDDLEADNTRLYHKALAEMAIETMLNSESDDDDNKTNT